MALDPELRAYLEAMEHRMTQHTDAKIDASRTELAATRETLEAKIEEARREAGAMMESIIHEIRALPEGLSTLHRQEADRRDASREEAMLNRHVLPLEASAVNHEQRITAVERHR